VFGSTTFGTLTLEVLGGAATRTTVSRVHLQGGAGDDMLTFDEANGRALNRDAGRGGNDDIIDGE
jgi:hypothetical protein